MLVVASFSVKYIAKGFSGFCVMCSFGFIVESSGSTELCSSISLGVLSLSESPYCTSGAMWVGKTGAIGSFLFAFVVFILSSSECMSTFLSLSAS